MLPLSMPHHRSNPAKFGHSMPLRFSAESTPNDENKEAVHPSPSNEETKQKGEPNAFIRGMKVIRNSILMGAGLLGIMVGADQAGNEGKVLDKLLETQGSSVSRGTRTFSMPSIVDNSSNELNIYIDDDNNNNIAIGSSDTNTIDPDMIDMQAVLRAMKRYDESWKHSRQEDTKRIFDGFTQPRPQIIIKKIIVPPQHPKIIIKNVVIQPQDRIIIRNPQTIVVQHHHGGHHTINNIAAFAIAATLNNAIHNNRFYGHQGPIHFRHRHGRW